MLTERLPRGVTHPPSTVLLHCHRSPTFRSRSDRRSGRYLVHPGGEDESLKDHGPRSRRRECSSRRMGESLLAARSLFRSRSRSSRRTLAGAFSVGTAVSATADCFARHRQPQSSVSVGRRSPERRLRVQTDLSCLARWAVQARDRIQACRSRGRDASGIGGPSRIGRCRRPHRSLRRGRCGFGTSSSVPLRRFNSFRSERCVLRPCSGPQLCS